MRRALAGQVRQKPDRIGMLIRLLCGGNQRRTFSCPVSLAAQSRQEAALNITDIKCQRSGSAWQKLCTALSGLFQKAVADGKIDARCSE